MLSLHAADLPPPSLGASQAQAPLLTAQHQQLPQNPPYLPGDLLPGAEGFAAAVDAEQPAAGGVLGRLSDSLSDIAAGAKGVVARFSDSMAGVAAAVAGSVRAVARALSGSDHAAGKYLSACKKALQVLLFCSIAPCIQGPQGLHMLIAVITCPWYAQLPMSCLLPDWYTVLSDMQAHATPKVYLISCVSLHVVCPCRAWSCCRRNLGCH